TRPIEGTEATIVVRGLSCPKCANNVNLQLGKVEGVGETHIDMGAGEVRVVFDTLAPVNPSRAALARAITDAGFTVVDVRTPWAGARHAIDIHRARRVHARRGVACADDARPAGDPD